ncbi:hypothetical protein ABMY26_06655 (plasmid) [Azospirillum sp. HJ39]|uniref:hypothetical protein n=1 Tax=Azospirillum sp. HJ39 TaxID=3159496 RepID=UPI003557A34C
MPHTENHHGLHLCALNEEQHGRTCDYWYTVTTHGFTPHTAFRRKAALIRWLDERGLTVDGDIPEPGTWGYFKITGTYRTAMHWSYDEFFGLQGEETKVLSNGRYTLGIITTDDDGVKVVHNLNPNCRHRPEFDYRTCEIDFM